MNQELDSNSTKRLFILICKRLNDMTDNLTQFDVTEEAGGDMDLVQASKNGDGAAFEQLVKRYDRKLLRIAQSVTRNREDSQDAVQEAFLKAYQHLADFREACQFSTWLIRITVNQGADEVAQAAWHRRDVSGRGLWRRGRHSATRSHGLGSQSRAALLGLRITGHPAECLGTTAPDLAYGIYPAGMCLESAPFSLMNL